MMLYFVSNRQDEILNKGGVKYTHIWGFEETRKHVEMSACFKMAVDLTKPILSNDNYQLIITTHSPVFYKLPDDGAPDDPWVNTLFVEKDGLETRITAKDASEVDESMGLMPLVAPFVEEAREKLAQLNAAVETAKRLAEQKTPTLFVEGVSDGRVLGRAIQLYDPTLLAAIHIHDGGVGYGSAQAVASRSTAWLLEMRHRAVAERTWAAALFDDDDEGRATKALVAEDVSRLKIKSMKEFSYFLLPCPKEIQAMRAAGFKMPADLEAYCTDDLWIMAEKRGWLEDVSDLSARLSAGLIRAVVNDGAQPTLALSDNAKRRLEKKLSHDGKDKASRYVVALDDKGAAKHLAHFKPLVEKLRTSLIAVAEVEAA